MLGRIAFAIPSETVFRVEAASWIQRLLSFCVAGVLLIGLLPNPVQAAAGETWRVAVPVANLRAAPAGNARLVTQLPQSTLLTELRREGNWIQVRLPDGQEAWAHQMVLTQSVELFGVTLLEADRARLRAAIQATDVRVVREVDHFPYDLYDPSGWRSGATEMAIGYTLQESLFAVAEITFRSENNTEQVRQIAEQVSEELGPWQRVQGRRSEGPVEFEWRLGELTVMVHRGWPDTTTYLTYEVPQRMAIMQSELQAR
ncbi:SH3 domain-containing protein [Marinospirillum sp. MEB164]|uniref:SH3 domain-containing protein n=1 Tax=Marinospirillum alkalitolerans TaxID=3123374 RepID=A0ABW8PUZ6_9GAMM